MTALAVVAGQLWRAPEQRTSSKSGKSFATAIVREGAGDAVTWCSVVAFAKNANELMQLKDGDVVSVSGPFTVGIYAKDGGPPRISLRIVADRIAAPRLSRKPFEAAHA
jgi:single-stranded DNA-binding protein